MLLLLIEKRFALAAPALQSPREVFSFPHTCGSAGITGITGSKFPHSKCLELLFQASFCRLKICSNILPLALSRLMLVQ